MYIQYLIQLHKVNKDKEIQLYSKNKNKNKDIKTVIDLSSKINMMQLTHTIKLGLRIKKINIGVQKIDGSYLNIFRMVIVNYSIKNKLERV